MAMTSSKPVLGKNLKSKKVVSQSGSELGHVVDAYFEMDGSIVSIVVRPERKTKEIEDYMDRNGLMSVPFADVKAIGRYVVVNFPFSVK